MSSPLDSQLRRAVSDRIRYYNDLGIYDFYRRPVETSEIKLTSVARAPSPAMVQVSAPEIPRGSFGMEEVLKPVALDTVSALRLIREDIGDCTRCRLHKQGRK